MKSAFRTIIAGLTFAMTNSGFSSPKAEYAQLTGVWGPAIVITLPSSGGPIEASVKETKIIYTDASGLSKPLPVQLVVIPSKKLYWVGYSRSVTYFVLKDKIVAVRPDFNDTLYFYPSADRLTTLDDQGAIQKTLNQKVVNFAAERFEYKAIVVGLEDALGLFPFTKEAYSGLGPAPKIEGVSVEANTFTINLKGGKDDKVKASVTFSDDFKLRRALLEGKQTFPKP